MFARFEPAVPVRRRGRSGPHLDTMQRRARRPLPNRAVRAAQTEAQGARAESDSARIMRMINDADSSRPQFGGDAEVAQLQVRSNVQPALNAAASAARSPVQRKGDGAAANKTGMPDRLKSGLENMSGMDLSDVRVHYGSDKPAQLQALAYTQGTDIHVGPGQERHLPHEAWHVVQQKQGRVRPTMHLHGAAINDADSLEQEADEMGARALQGPAAAPESEAVQRKAAPAGASGATAPIQRVRSVITLLDSLDKIIKPPLAWRALGLLAAFSDNGSDPSRPLFIDEYRTFLDTYAAIKVDSKETVGEAYASNLRTPAKRGHRYLNMTWSELRDEIDLEKRTAEEMDKKAHVDPERMQELQNQSISGLGGAASSML